MASWARRVGLFIAAAACLGGCAHSKKVDALEKRVALLEDRLLSKELGEEKTPAISASPVPPMEVEDQVVVDSLASTDTQAPPPQVKKMTPAPQSLAVRDSVVRAKEYFVDGDYKRAYSRARQALRMDPYNKIALQIYGASACHRNLKRKAEEALANMDESQRRYLRTLCRRLGVSLGKVGPPPDLLQEQAQSPVQPQPRAMEPAPVSSPAMGSEDAMVIPRPKQAPAALPPYRDDTSTLTRMQIKAGMSTARDRISRCYQLHGVPGLCLIRVTISPDGTVKSAAAVGGVLANSPTGDCIAKAVKTSTFPTFTGAPVTVTHPFILR